MKRIAVLTAMLLAGVILVECVPVAASIGYVLAILGAIGIFLSAADL